MATLLAERAAKAVAPTMAVLRDMENLGNEFAWVRGRAPSFDGAAAAEAA
jgi:hypothetical protein